jgi:SanA protein
MGRLAWYALFVIAAFLVGAEWTVRRVSDGLIFATPDGLPAADVALVLGTARVTGAGRANSFYAPRLDVAAELFRLGKVRGIIVSGDNSRADYSEPDDMKADLVARGVPERFVTCDYAGFSTFDSMQRVSRVFGQTHVIVVSQRFHLERALFLARADGLAATGCAAAEAPLGWRIRVRLREVLARGKAVLDVGLNRGPKFLGPRELVLLAGAD